MCVLWMVRNVRMRKPIEGRRSTKGWKGEGGGGYTRGKWMSALGLVWTSLRRRMEVSEQMLRHVLLLLLPPPLLLLPLLLLVLLLPLPTKPPMHATSPRGRGETTRSACQQASSSSNRWKEIKALPGGEGTGRPLVTPITPSWKARAQHPTFRQLAATALLQTLMIARRQPREREGEQITGTGSTLAMAVTTTGSTTAAAASPSIGATKPLPVFCPPAA